LADRSAMSELECRTDASGHVGPEGLIEELMADVGEIGAVELIRERDDSAGDVSVVEAVAAVGAEIDIGIRSVRCALRVIPR